MKSFLQRLARHQQRWFGRWHLWLGLGAGLIIAVVGLTGSLLAFRDEIDVALNRELFEVTAPTGQTKLAFDAVIPLVEQNEPKLRVYSIYAPNLPQPEATYLVYGKQRQPEWFVNPYTGAVLGQRDREQSFIGVVLRLHRTLLLPGIGRWIVGLAALSLLLLTISGLRLWLPAKWKQLRAALSVKFGASFKRQNLDWHNVLGLYSSPVVVSLALSGVVMTLSSFVIPLLYLLSFESPKKVTAAFTAKSVYTVQARPLTVRQALAVCQQAVPAGTVLRLGLPTDSLGVYRADIHTPGANADGIRDLVTLDQYSGKVLFNSRRDVPPLGQAYLTWLGPIHFGTFGGLPTRILALLGSLIPAALLVTGVLIWWPRWQKQRRKAGKAKPVSVAVPTTR